MTNIYIFDFGNRVKIGQSKNVESRLKQIENAAGEKVINQFYIESPSLVEKMIHDCLKEYRTIGEYFTCSFETAKAELLNIIEIENPDIFSHVEELKPKTLLIELLNYMVANPEADHGGQLIVLNTFVKEDIIERLEIKMNTLDHALSKLVKSGIIKRIGTGTYQGNPHMFGRGEWADIKAIRATFDFNEGTVQVDIQPNETETNGD
jgi:hypothetical protein